MIIDEHFKKVRKLSEIKERKDFFGFQIKIRLYCDLDGDNTKKWFFKFKHLQNEFNKKNGTNLSAFYLCGAVPHLHDHLSKNTSRRGGSSRRNGVGLYRGRTEHHLGLLV